MSARQQQPAIEPVPDSDGNAIVVERIAILLPLCRRTLCIEVGFYFDGASIPWLAWTLLKLHPFHPDILLSALAHDALVRAELLPAPEANAEFRELLKLNSKRGREVAQEFFLAVTAATKKVWGEHTAQSIAEARKFCSIQ